MALPGGMTLVGDFLQFVGVFVSFSIAYVAYRGLKQTESSSLLRLATAFIFLGFGFLVEGLVGLGQIVPAPIGSVLKYFEEEVVAQALHGTCPSGICQLPGAPAKRATSQRVGINP